jgi:hypothetical protein
VNRMARQRIEKRMLWWQVPGSDGGSQYCESRWKPEGWANKSLDLAAQRVEIRLRARGPPRVASHARVDR